MESDRYIIDVDQLDVCNTATPSTAHVIPSTTAEHSSSDHIVSLSNRVSRNNHMIPHSSRAIPSTAHMIRTGVHMSNRRSSGDIIKLLGKTPPTHSSHVISTDDHVSSASDVITAQSGLVQFMGLLGHPCIIECCYIHLVLTPAAHTLNHVWAGS